MLCSKKAIEDTVLSGRICLLDIDVQGVKSIKQTDLKCRYVFVKPPSIAELVGIFSCYDFFLLQFSFFLLIASSAFSEIGPNWIVVSKHRIKRGHQEFRFKS
jgi:Guanylate kinase